MLVNRTQAIVEDCFQRPKLPPLLCKTYPRIWLLHGSTVAPVGLQRNDNWKRRIGARMPPARNMAGPILANNTMRMENMSRLGLKATTYAASVPQPGRPNEDCFFVGRIAGAPLAAAFDGQGNAEGAAKKAARQLERLYTESQSGLDWMKTAKLLDSHLLGANKSTLVAASLAGDVVSICAVGDSRAHLVRNGQANILTEGASKQQLGSGCVSPLIKEFGVQDRDVVLLMTDGAWTRFSLYQLSQTVMKNLLSLPELPNSILKQAAKGGICDDMTVVAFVVRRQ